MSTQIREKFASIDEARQVVLSNVWDLESESAGVVNALGKTLTEDIVSDMDIPRFPTASVDGYAVIAADVKGASERNPVRLSVLCEAMPGSASGKEVLTGTAVGLQSGTAIPMGSNAVVPRESCYRDGASLYVMQEVSQGENAKPAGQEMKKGDLVIKRGTLLGPVHLALLAALGKPGASVTRKPRIAVITFGKDVVDIIEDLNEGKVRNISRYILVGQILAAGCELGPLAHVREGKQSVEDALRKVQRADAIIISGGITLNENDPVREVVGKAGRHHVSGVAMKPGKAFVFSTIEGKPVFMLPGDALSTFVTFEVLVRPALLKMLGRELIDRHVVNASITSDVKQFYCHRQFIPAHTTWEGTKFVTKPLDTTCSGLPRDLMSVNSIIVAREDRDDIRRNDTVEVMMLE